MYGQQQPGQYDDQIAFNPGRQPDHLKLFGYQLWGTPDEKKPENVYEMEKIRSNFHLEYIGESYNTNNFFSMVMQKIYNVNQEMKEERIKAGGVNIMGNLPQDVIYKFRVVLYGKGWT